VTKENCPMRGVDKKHVYMAGRCAFCDIPAPVYNPNRARPTAQEQCPVYRKNMKDAGRGHLLP